MSFLSINSLTTDSFILALRRFIAHRGNVRELRSDNGSNFVGAKRELQSEFKKMDHRKISDFLRGNGSDWVKWINNPPYASHFGGVWERQIRTAREILNGILFNHGTRLNDESLKTMFCEIECVINSCPLTVECLNDPLNPFHRTTYSPPRTTSSYHHLGTSKLQTSTQESIGDECSI